VVFIPDRELAYMRTNATLFSRETKHIISTTILKKCPKPYFYTPAADANRCDQSDRAYAIHEEQSNMLFTAITVGRLLGNTPHTPKKDNQ
jgi:hypothetical protein